MMEVKSNEETRLVGHRITPEGIREVFYNDSKKEEILGDLSTEPLREVHEKFRDHHRQAFFAICCVIDSFVEDKREMPILREEAVGNLGIRKQVLKDLEKFGLVESVMLPVKTKDGKNMGGRLVLILTSQGRSLKKSIQEAMIDAGNEEQSG